MLAMLKDCREKVFGESEESKEWTSTVRGE